MQLMLTDFLAISTTVVAEAFAKQFRVRKRPTHVETAVFVEDFVSQP